MVTTYSNATSAKMVADAYHSIVSRNRIRKEHGLKNETELTIEGICGFLSERKMDMQFSVPRLAGFLREEGVDDQKVIDEVGKRIFVAQSLRKAALLTDGVLTYAIKEIDSEVIDIVIRFLHGKMGLTSHEISGLLNLGDQKAYAATSKWDAEEARRKQVRRNAESRPNVFAPIPQSTNAEIDRLIMEGKRGDREIAELTGVSVASVQNRRSRKNERETVTIMKRAGAQEEKEVVGPSDVFGIAMFPKKGTDSIKNALRA
ncbi:MAG: hypothetical protein KGH54_04415 [Candidatus Micrarchaeota archaeon]|nr:hypothetical protein [Candidatus Micrarchaeota archaeon]